MLKKIFFLFFIISIMFSCATVDTSKIENLSNGEITIIGHAGSGFLSLTNFQPPNSLKAIKDALDEGAKGIEVDVQVSKDGVPILYHDKNLSSLTGIDNCIRNLEADSIVGIPYQCGSMYDFFQSEKIISLEELLIYLKEEATFPELHLDLRHHNDCNNDDNITSENYTFILHEILDRLDIPKNKITAISMWSDLLNTIHKTDSTINLAYEEVGNFDNGLALVLKEGYQNLIIKTPLITKEQVKKAHDNDVKIILFGGNSSNGIKKLIEMNPDAIQVNKVSTAMDLLD